MGKLIDVKPKVGLMIDVKPKVGDFGKTQGRVYEVTLGASQYMGLPFLLTYPSAITVVQDHD